MHPGTSFPVGKVEFINLFPLSFSKFLLATGNEPIVKIIDQLNFNLLKAFSTKLTELLNRVAYRDRTAFKLYAFDTGLLCRMSQLDPKSILQGNSLFMEFKEALTEQFVLQQLKTSMSQEPFYWKADNSSGEIDFIIQINGAVLPLEVKASENLQAKSLKSYCNRYSPERAYRTSLADYREEDWLTNIPLYAIHSFKKIVEQNKY